MHKAFTLIELLVVVLIIGILAAIAVPQYQKAVFKTRFTTWMPFLRSIKEAQERYYMANGNYSNRVSNLDISIPASCKIISDEGQISCGTDWYLGVGDNTNPYLWFMYCPGKNQGYSSCVGVRKADMQLNYDNTNQAGIVACGGLAKNMCKGIW